MKKNALPDFIEVETSKRCNRKCNWCPVGYTNERESQELMDWQLFVKIIDNLSMLNYEGRIALHNYNEPLLNPRIIEEIALVKEKLPKAKSSIFTNGDYLTVELINSLANVGLSWMRVTLYPPKHKVVEPSIEGINKWLKRKDLITYEWSYSDFFGEKGLKASTRLNELLIEVIMPNVMMYNSRAGASISFQDDFRTLPCSMTSVSAAIDYKGQMKMCCNIFPENQEHKEYITGLLNESTFSDIWFSERMTDLRKQHILGKWDSSPICKLCHHYV